MSSHKFLLIKHIRTPLTVCVRNMGKGEPGSGSGDGGGAGGAIRDAGGAFGKRQAAQEDQYFRKLNEEQIQKMREGLKDEVSFHEKQIKAHQDAIKRHKKRIEELD